MLVVPFALLVALGFVANGPLSLLDPNYGVWTDAEYSAWGNQTYTLSGLSSSVTVVRDGGGTTHIYATNDRDLFYAQGFSQASDRLFQMEAQSLMAQGNLSSLVGPSAESSDLAFRYLGIPNAAGTMARELPSQYPWAAADLQSYSNGVNAYLSWAEAHHALPLPFKVLGYTPFKWTPYDTLAFERLMVLSQTGGISEPLMTASLADAVGDNMTNSLFSIYPPYWQNFTVMPGNGSLNGVSLESLQGVTPGQVFSQDWLASWATGIASSEEKALAPLYRAALVNVTDPYFTGYGPDAPSEGVGSNSWVVAANKTGLGVPLLANDPHLPLQLPSLWVSTQLADPSYDVEGWALAGAPGILIGHDRNVAWGLTYSGGATALDYVETLQGDTYFENGTWHPLTWQNQTFQVSGAAPVSVHVPWTDNGPVVARIGNYGVSVRWPGSGPTWELIAELAFDKSQSIAQTESILSQYWVIPSLNFMMAEHNSTSGASHIGWYLPAHFALVHSTLPGGPTITVVGERAPLNGSGGFEPAGYVTGSYAPQSLDPVRGYLFAPNQPSVGQDYPYPFIGSWWDAGGRAHTIGTNLAETPHMGVAQMEALQANVTDSWSLMMKPMLLAALSVVASDSTGPSNAAQVAIQYVQGWNGSFDTNEVAPTIYSYWWNEILQQFWEPAVTPLNIPGVPTPDPNEILWVGETDPASPWFPNEQWPALAETAASSALTLLSGKLGNDLSGWTWGKVHQFTDPSLLGYASFSEGPYPQWGDSYTPSVAPFADNLTVPLVEVSIGSSLRMVTVPEAGPPSFGIIPGGESGNVASPYYANQLPLWLAHQYLNESCVPTSAGPFPGGEVSTWTLSP